MPEPVAIENNINVARAIFFPQMTDSAGNITRAVFSLRHNETYISVCQMCVGSWMDDMKAIPVNNGRDLVGYTILNVGDIRSQRFSHDGHLVSFDVIDKHTNVNKSHAGIFILLDGNCLKGDKNSMLKPLPENTYAAPLLLRVQSRLLKLARKNYIRTAKETCRTHPL